MVTTRLMIGISKVLAINIPPLITALEHPLMMNGSKRRMMVSSNNLM
jgi:hypothetical protein